MLLSAPMVVLSYLLGSFPTARLVARRYGFDPTAEGSGNPGASNVMRIGGARAGTMVFGGDLVKGAAAAGAGYAVGGRGLALGCGLAAVVGHTVPVSGRRGGKGVATGGGLVTVLHPLLSVAMLAAWLLVARVSGRASVASLLLLVAMPLVVGLVGVPAWELGALTGLSVYIAWRHRDNVGRLLDGSERNLREAP